MGDIDVRQLERAAQQPGQTGAFAEISRLAGASPGDLAQFGLIVQTALRLCNADGGIFWQWDDGLFHAAAVYAAAEFADFLRTNPQSPPPASELGSLFRGVPVIHRADYASGRYANASLNRAFVDLGGGRAGLLLPLWKGPALIGAIRIFRRTARAFSEKHITLLRNLSPLFAAVANPHTSVDRSIIGGLAKALDPGAQAALVLDRRGRVLEANVAAEVLFDRDIRVIGRRLEFRDKIANAALATLLTAANATPGGATLDRKRILVRRDGRPPLLARALPIEPVADQTFSAGLVLLTLTELTPTPAPDPTVLAHAFGLTRAEARLASLLATGLSPEAAAQRIGVSPGTARSQLKAVFAKTQTHRQSELAALLARF
jgi:DNA-binding CsgD family transcriptional regulator